MGEEENRYTSQLKDVYDSCDTTGTGYLDKEELTELCHKLHLEGQLPLLLETLLGNNHFARVNFEEFKEGFVTILSSTINLGLSDDESSYLEPVIPDEIEPKYITKAKRYGRRTRPELESTKLETPKYLQEEQRKANVKSQLRRSTSLESVESLKSDEEAESSKEQQQQQFEGQGQMCTWDDNLIDNPREVPTLYLNMSENQIQVTWEDLGIGNNGYLNKQELAAVCKNIGLKEMEKEELEELFYKLDSDGDGRVSLKEFQYGFFSHICIPCPCSSTPLKSKRQRSLSNQILKDNGQPAATPPFLSGSVALNLFSSIDDGSGFASVEQVVSIWAWEGVENCKEIFKSLDCNVEEKVNLKELSVVLDDELIASKNGLQQAAVASYKHELHHLRTQVERISSERNKARAEAEKAEKRNWQLFKEVDDNYSALEHHNESKLRALEQDFKEKLMAVKSEVKVERELLMQQVYHQRTKLEADLRHFKEEDSSLRKKLTLMIKENSRLQNEVAEVVQKLTESENQVLKLQRDLNFMLKDKLGLLDPFSTELFDQEEHFAAIIREYELQCRELHDKNDELQMEVEKLRSQLHAKKPNLACYKMKTSNTGERPLPGSEKTRVIDNIQRDDHLLGYQHLPIKGQNDDTFITSDPYSVSIETELLVEELKEQNQNMKMQLETKVNYYEREIELIKNNFEKERKDIEQGFKIKISELEEQKHALEELNVKCQEVIDGLKNQVQKLDPIQEMKRFEKERTEMEQYYAKEISNLGQRLAQERERLEDDSKMKHEMEMRFMRLELHRVSEDNILLNNKLGKSQREVEDIGETNKKQKKHIDELKMEKEKAMYEIKELNDLNKCYKEEILQLNTRTAQLSHEFFELSSNNKASQKTIKILNKRFVELESQKEQEVMVAKQLQEASAELTKEHFQQQLTWQGEKELLSQELKSLKEKLLEANTRLCLAESQHAQQLQQVKTQMDKTIPKDHLVDLETRLAEEQKTVRKLQGDLNFQGEQMKWQLAIYQEEYENSRRIMEERLGEVEMNLKNTQILLQEKMVQIKEQFEKNAKSNLLLKDLYVENAHLMKMLQVTEQMQKSTENRNLILEEKISSLNKLVGEITFASQ
ncbi:ninein-like protein [Python bivittatus]|uniref:Ninein-like protein n=1 Tax=Python bivittatus TaxID=176946 RepID=A0A9F5N1L2_PYTBI|nr:ninein-like protein [Python bivittatus]